MKVKLTDKTTFRGKKLKKGAEVELPNGVALRLVAMGKATKA